MRAVARFARAAVTDGIRKNDEVAARIQQLSRPKEHAGKLRGKKIPARTAGAVQYQHGVCDSPGCIPLRGAERGIVQSHLRQRFPGAETEHAGNEVAFL